MEDQSRRSSTTIANRSSAVLSGFQRVDQRDQDTGPRITNGMAQSNSTTKQSLASEKVRRSGDVPVDVDLGWINLADLLSDAHDNGESFVELESSNIVDSEVGFL